LGELFRLVSVNMNDKYSLHDYLFWACAGKNRTGLKQPDGDLGKIFNHSAVKISFHEKNMAE